MKIVVDSNRVIAALIKDGTTREILFNRNFKFFAPEYIRDEIEKYKNEIIQRADINNKEFEILISLIFEYITIVPKSEYNSFIDKLKNEISDINDLAYFAACLSIKADGIWTHDLHFKEQEKYKIYTNIDMIRMSGKKKESSD